MAYNKSKYVEAAQKLLNQGKVAQAIAEYQQILKYEPRDQVTLMTIGELYIRQGETHQAIDYFERLAQLFVSDGFLTKAIAVYKRIAKLAPEEIRPLEKLADLYVQQGVMSEARPLFLQLAELHLKNGKQPEAIALLKKLLLAEPDNLRIQIRLADLYQAMGQAGEALECYVSAAQRALARGDQAECEKLADKALQLNPKHLDAMIVKARAYSSSVNIAQSAQILERVPDLEKGGEPAELLMDMYLKNAKWVEATSLALRIFSADEKNFTSTQKVTEALLESHQGERAMAVLARIHIPMIDAGEHDTVGHLVNELATSLKGRVEPLEWLVDRYGRTSDSFRLPDALANLGEALIATGDLERAKEIFEQLVDREPESESAKRRLNDVRRKLGLETDDASTGMAAGFEEENLQADIPKPEAPKLRKELEEATPEVAAKTPATTSTEAELDEETQKFIAQSLTDVDLFASYGLTQKAIGLLEAILRRAPMHTPTLEKLLDFVLGAGDDRRTAELAAQLEHIHTMRVDARSGERFGELRRRFQRAAGLSDEEVSAAVAAAMPHAVETVPVEEAGDGVLEELPVPSAEALALMEDPAPVEELALPQPAPVKKVPEASAPKPVAATEEVDLSSEWASLLEETREPAPHTQAAKPPELAPATEEFELPEFTLGEEAPVEEEAEAHATEHPKSSFEEISAEPAVVASHEAEAEPVEELALPAASDPAFDIDQDFELVLEPQEETPTVSQAPAPAQPQHHEAMASAPVNGQVFSSDSFLADLAKEIDELGLDALTPSTSQSEAVPQPAAERAETREQPGESGPLKEVFEEFRAELGEMGVEDEDLETHYNLGIAFREMGLLEEAIGEFQKVAKATDRGRAFRYTMQCCTLLGLAFMEKGQPAIAAIWYERALKTPGNDPESVLALRYDLGVAQESAGEPVAALKSFSQVYAMNIDYRDVAERIAALQKPIRRS